LFLKRVTITGFKSFAGKTVIDLERGITGVVGPNGSGKSNLADAIRWALGEQGKNRLRLGDRDEVVFAGSAGRARASFAEVVMLFDNEDGAFPLDLSEVEISRRMYRSGETDYRLAGRSARLSDIQSLLAQAGVGASSYAVIGQGMIDSMLMSSPADRKLLFEDAAGIRAPELGREAALRKLAATATNLTRLRDIAAELAPRLGSLEAAVGAADERTALEARVADLRAQVVHTGHAHWTAQVQAATQQLADIAAAGHQLRHDRQRLEQAQARQHYAEAAAARHRQALQAHLAQLERARDQAAADVASARAATAAAARDQLRAAGLKDRLASAAAELAVAQAHLAELHAELSDNAEAGARAAKAVDRAGRDVATAQAALVAIREGTGDGARDQYLDHALSILKTLAVGLGTPEFTEQQIRLLVHKAGRLLSHATRSGAAEILAELKAAQKHLEAVMGKRDTAVEHQTNVSITGRSLEIDVAHQEADVVRLAAHQAQIEAELVPLLHQAARQPQLVSAETTLQAALATTTARLDDERTRLAQLTATAGDVTTASQIIAGLERITAALSGLAEDQGAAQRARAGATQQLAAVTRHATDWSIAPSPKFTPTQDLAVLADQLARAETLLEARAQMYEEQVSAYQEVTARHTELVAQIADLEAAEADLTALIAELDVLIRSRFKENFQALAEQFSLYFARLFDGGTASLELSEAEDAGYGITIKASPKGKRLATIAALSGGERALAGVALVAAIMRVNPSPFVVLDEIDAALDEANSGRLADILTELQQYSQLIVITHNRQTMKAANVLFGVTINEHHVSHLISMRLEQATQLAAR
jgi:chromosome segregation protein